MKKITIMALAALLVTGAAFAQVSTLNADKLFIKPNASFSGGGATGGLEPGTVGNNAGSGPLTTNNDDSCDIAEAPAATLLLPYFEVDTISDQTQARNYLFSVTNVTAMPQIAHVTIWTDRSFPVIDFNLFLTGYDVVPLNLYDIIVRGQIPATSITGPRGRLSLSNTTGNPLFNADPTTGAATRCAGLTSAIPDGLRAAVLSALTTGSYAHPTLGTLNNVGNSHANVAIGYVTVDVSSNCTTTLPTTSGYYTGEILFDNVFIGEYVRVNPSVATGNYAGANPMVHIRAIPEGGSAGSAAIVNLPFTFYDRYTPTTNRKADRRQPLPGRFAARYISDATLGFATDFAIWREGTVGGASSEAGAVSPNSAIVVTEVVKFDESENPFTFAPSGCTFSPCEGTEGVITAEAQRVAVTNAGNRVIPAGTSPSGDKGGWVYLNLNNASASAPVAAYSASRGAAGTHPGVSQNWVIVQATAEGRYGADFNAAFLGNGCSPNPGISVATSTATTLKIGPSPNVTP